MKLKLIGRNLTTRFVINSKVINIVKSDIFPKLNNINLISKSVPAELLYTRILSGEWVVK